MRELALVYAAIMVAAGLLLLCPEPIESAFGIDLDHCTLPKCITECKKALQEKYLSATCAMGSQTKFCICLG